MQLCLIGLYAWQCICLFIDSVKSSYTSRCVLFTHRDVLKKNGSAVDAAIASLFCLGVLDAQNSGIGGGFHMVVYDRWTNRYLN